MKSSSKTISKKLQKKTQRNKSLEELESEITCLRNEYLEKKALKIALTFKMGKGGKAIIEDLIIEAIGTDCDWCNDKLTLFNLSIDYKKPLPKLYKLSLNKHVFSNNRKNLMVICKNCNSLRSNIPKSLFHKLMDFLNTENRLKYKIKQALRYYNFRYNNFSYKIFRDITAKKGSKKLIISGRKMNRSVIIHKKALNLKRTLRWGKGGTVKAERMLIETIGTNCYWCGKKLTVENISIDHKKPLNRVIGIKLNKDVYLNNRRNLRAICLKCNYLKSNIPEKQFKILMDFLNKNPRLKYIIISALTVYNSRFEDEMYKLERSIV